MHVESRRFAVAGVEEWPRVSLGACSGSGGVLRVRGELRPGVRVEPRLVYALEHRAQAERLCGRVGVG
jgi:hypothetical protein